MGKHRSAEQIKQEILRGTQHLVAVGGMSNFSFPKLSAQTGISAPTVYEHYKNKEELLTSCFMSIDEEISSLVERLLAAIPAHLGDPKQINDYCWLLWNVYWRFLLADADKTQFYWSFYNSEYYTQSVFAQRNRNFSAFNDFVDQIDKRFHISEKSNVFMLVVNLLNVTVSSAVKVLTGEVENNEITVNTVYRMVFQPLFSVFGFDSDERSSAPPQMHAST